MFRGVTCSKPKDNNQRKYDRSHADEINETYTFSFTGHFILPRSEPKAASPFPIDPRKRWRRSWPQSGGCCDASPPGQPLVGNRQVASSDTSLSHLNHGDDRTRPIDVSCRGPF